MIETVNTAGKRVRIIDIAEHMGISKAAVASVLGSSAGSIRVSAETRRNILKIAKQMNYTSVVVLGDPDYYGRFGFKPSVNFGITCTNEIPSEYVQIVELQEGTLDSVNGTISF